MQKISRSVKILFVVVLTLLLGTLACAIDFGETDSDPDASVQQTLSALQMTQAALDDQDSGDSSGTIEETAEPQIEEVPTEEVAAEPPDILYEGISFSYDDAVAQSVNPSTVQGQDMGEDYMPGETYPTHVVFNFNGYPAGDKFHTPQIFVYPVEDYRAMSPFAADIIDRLKQTLIEKSEGGSLSDLPFLPMWNAAQVFSAKVAYFNFENGTGVRYLTMYAQALFPVDNQNLFYTYQGLTNDGRYYISAILPITHPGLPDQGQIDDYLAFEENWDSYIADTIAWLNSQPGPTFFPNMDLLDAMIASFEINR